MPEKENIPIEEIEKQQRREEFRERFNRLLEEHQNLSDIAHILNADGFVYRAKSKKGEVVGFNVKGFRQREMNRERPIPIPNKILTIGTKILPPGEGELIRGTEEGMELVEADQGRTRFFMELMEEKGIENVVAIQEKTDPNDITQREEEKEKVSPFKERHYVTYLIPEKNKIVFVCNQGGNTTYIVQSEDPTSEWKLYSPEEKKELRKKGREEGGVTVHDWNKENDPEKWKRGLWKKIESQEIGLKKVRKKKKSEEELAPYQEGSMPRTRLQKELGVFIKRKYGDEYKFSRDSLLKIEEQYPDQDNLKKKMKGPGEKRWNLQYPPEVVSFLRKKVEEMEYAPKVCSTRVENTDWSF